MLQNITLIFEFDMELMVDKRIFFYLQTNYDIIISFVFSKLKVEINFEVNP